MTTILNVEPSGYSDEAHRILLTLGDVVERPMSRPELLEGIGGFDVLITRLGHRIDRQVLEHGGGLRAIVSATTGLEHIDTEYAAEKGIAVLSLRGETEFLRTITATAEHTWALLLALVRRIPEAVSSTRAGEWDRDRFKGRQLVGKRLGIVGMGRVGRQVAGYGQAFGMLVTGFDPFVSEWPEGVDRSDDLTDLLAGSNIVSLHPGLDLAVGLIGTEELASVSPGAFLVNTSRGAVVDEHALVAALEAGTLSGAAVDVLSDEHIKEAREASPILAYAGRHANLIVTPHIAGATFESMEMTEVFMARKLERFLADGEDGQA